MLKLQHDEITSGGPWHFHSVPCVDGRVATVGPRLITFGQKTISARDFESSGVQVTFSIPSSFHFLMHESPQVASVVHYQGEYDNNIMQAERPGDRVQVCLMAFPTPTFNERLNKFQCDPDRDPRGYTFRIYDYRQRTAYYGSSSEHNCGGA